MTNPSTPLLKMSEIAFPTPIRIDAPAQILLSSVTFVRPTQEVETFGNMSFRFVP